ncbi:DUF5362 family protein [Salisaeta longa]|uniref:DUF5362 family protein n=1 Tax=Salisaeta longa TaxID=503170 RepID=UPI0003B58BF5|nr:DUF5362 family protein [Salisaeta longa]
MDAFSSASAHDLLEAIASKAEDTSRWLKILGVINIIIGVMYLVVLIGALYIWLGVLLYQAGNAAHSPSPADLVRMLDKLRLFFLTQVVLFALALLFIVAVLLIAVLTGSLFTAFDPSTLTV